jgi:hypothetical protein
VDGCGLSPPNTISLRFLECEGARMRLSVRGDSGSPSRGIDRLGWLTVLSWVIPERWAIGIYARILLLFNFGVDVWGRLRGLTRQLRLPDQVRGVLLQARALGNCK